MKLQGTLRQWYKGYDFLYRDISKRRKRRIRGKRKASERLHWSGVSPKLRNLMNWKMRVVEQRMRDDFNVLLYGDGTEPLTGSRGLLDLIPESEQHA